MATTYKALLNNDIVSTRTMLHEAIPITGSIVSGTYGTFPNEENIKNYAHGMFQSVYDYPFLSSSANHIFDLTVGYSAQSGLDNPANSQNTKKINMYNQMAQVLMGYDATGSILRFDQDGNIDAGGTKHDACIFINFARLLTKDEIKKGSFTIALGGTTAFPNANNSLLTITDAGAENSYFINSPAGEYGILSCSSGGAYSPGVTPGTSGLVGLLFYQAGIAVLTASVFEANTSPGGVLAADAQMNVAGVDTINALLTGGTISSSCDAFRHRWFDNSLNNTTELNSTIHFCRINNNDYNYSANPTYLSSSKIVVKNNTLDAPITYLTTVGLYSADNELLAVAKVSEPLKKDPTNEMTLRVRLDY